MKTTLQAKKEVQKTVTKISHSTQTQEGTLVKLDEEVLQELEKFNNQEVLIGKLPYCSKTQLFLA